MCIWHGVNFAINVAESLMTYFLIRKYAFQVFILVSVSLGVSIKAPSGRSFSHCFNSSKVLADPIVLSVDSAPSDMGTMRETNVACPSREATALKET